MDQTALHHVGEVWERLAQVDPLWAVLSEPDKQHRRWNLAEFLQTGVDEIEALLADLDGFGSGRRGAALDFGCGVGRLTQPLALSYDRATGVDISPTMIETAQTLAGALSGATFIVNERPDLAVFDDSVFDLVYSNIVLQHMPPDLARSYLAEFFRIVRPGGFVVFQIPSHLTDEWLPFGNDGTQLAEGLHDAVISVPDPPAAMTAGAPYDIDVVVRNASGGSWFQDLTNQINLGNHWVDCDGAIVVTDDGRGRIPGRVDPGQEVVVPLRVHAPALPGTYQLQLDLVQEGVTWFAPKGSAVSVTEIDVRPAEPSGATAPDTSDGSPPTATAPGAAEPADADAYPTFMMRGIRRDEVVALVGQFGGEVLDMREHITEWVSYRYVTRRSR